jgi:hypothetical protein
MHIFPSLYVFDLVVIYLKSLFDSFYFEELFSDITFITLLGMNIFCKLPFRIFFSW